MGSLTRTDVNETCILGQQLRSTPSYKLFASRAQNYLALAWHLCRETKKCRALEKTSQSFLQVLAVVTRERQLRSIQQDDAILAVKPRLQLFNAIYLDD